LETIKSIQTRNSIPFLEDPAPTEEEMKEVYKAALRAPDHAWLRPWKYIEVTGKGRQKLANSFLNAANLSGEEITEEYKEKLLKAPFRAPMIIILIADIKEHPKVPKIEQLLSLGASAQNILLSINSLGYGAVWRTGKMAFNPQIVESLGLPKNNEIIGYLYIGTPSREEKVIPNLNIDDYLTKLT
jgi:nitroreductase